MLQTQHGGATARPFVTTQMRSSIELFLRIAPELFLKRAVVGGLERVFEINRNFRNEGVDSSHSPEFAMLEFYQAFADYQEMATITRELIQEVARSVTGSEIVTRTRWHVDRPVRCMEPQVDLYESSRRPGETDHTGYQPGSIRISYAMPLGNRLPPRGFRASWLRSCSSTTCCPPSRDPHSSWITRWTPLLWCVRIARNRCGGEVGPVRWRSSSRPPDIPNSLTR